MLPTARGWSSGRNGAIGAVGFQGATALDEKRNREERESMELALRLFRLPGGGQAGKGQTHGNREQQKDCPVFAGRRNVTMPTTLLCSCWAWKQAKLVAVGFWTGGTN